MSDTNFDDAARVLESRDSLTGSFELNGDEYPLKVQEPTLGELEAIEDGLGDNADETDAIKEIADEYLLAPEVDVREIGVSKLFALFDGMRETWQQSDAFDEAEAEMPLESGNSQPSQP
jgi:hypothetical protein